MELDSSLWHQMTGKEAMDTNTDIANYLERPYRFHSVRKRFYDQGWSSIRRCWLSSWVMNVPRDGDSQSWVTCLR